MRRTPASAAPNTFSAFRYGWLRSPGGPTLDGFDSLSAVHRIQGFYETQILALREGGEMAFQIQEGRRLLVYALATDNKASRLAYIDQTRASDKSVERIAVRLSALRADPGIHRMLSDVRRDWKTYLSIRDEVIDRIARGNSQSALAFDLYRAQPAFDALEQKLTALRHELDRSSSTELAQVSHTLRRTMAATGLLLLLMCLSFFYVVLNLQRRRTVGILRKVNGDLRRAQELVETREAEARRLAQVASRTTNSVVITDLEGRIEWANESFTRITGYTLEEVLGKKPGSFLLGPETSAEQLAVMRQAVGEHRGFQADLVNYTKSGTPTTSRSIANRWSRMACLPDLSLSNRRPRSEYAWKRSCESAKFGCAPYSTTFSTASLQSTSTARSKQPIMQPSGSSAIPAKNWSGQTSIC